MDLKALEDVQTECARRVIREDSVSSVMTVGGVDLTFEDPKANPTRGWACLVVVDIQRLKPVYTHVVEGFVDFPYVPTFLAFRELPLMLKLYEEAKVKPDLFMIDGQGIAHPRGCGIASHFGVETQSASIGVAKTLLVGRYKALGGERGSTAQIVYKGRVVGMAVRTKTGAEPVYVSIGHRVSLSTAVELVLKTSIYRIPEPTRLAHNLLQRVRRDAIKG